MLQTTSVESKLVQKHKQGVSLHEVADFDSPVLVSSENIEPLHDSFYGVFQNAMNGSYNL